MFVKKIWLIVYLVLIAVVAISCGSGETQEAPELSDDSIATIVSETLEAHVTNTPLPSLTLEQAESATEGEVTSTCEPTLVSLLPGIDEPVFVENIQVQVLGASTQQSVPMGDDEMCPDNPSDTFFEVQVAIEGVELVGHETVFDWAGDNIRLVYYDEEYEMIAVGVEYDQGFFVGYIFTFTVLKDSQFARYTLQVADEVSIDLGSFFE